MKSRIRIKVTSKVRIRIKRVWIRNTDHKTGVSTLHTILENPPTPPGKYWPASSGGEYEKFSEKKKRRRKDRRPREKVKKVK